MTPAPRRRTRPSALALAGLAALAGTALLPAAAGQAVEPTPGASPAPAPVAAPCQPVPANRPVCAAAGPVESVSFLDPTATVTGAQQVRLEGRVYVAPFARLLAGRGASITIGKDSNVQDSVLVAGAVGRSTAARKQLAKVGLTSSSGVQTGERVILAHGSSVIGPARLGVLADGQQPPANDSGVFVSFGARVDGAVLERDSGLSALSRVGPGVRLRSGTIVLPGKDVTTQQEADDPALGKVRPIVEVDRLFNKGVVEVNEGLAREYSRLARERPDAVRGINIDPGGNAFDRGRDAATVGSSLCAGPDVRRPGFRNRIIGDACFEDSLAALDAAMGSRISIRADEGGPFAVGTIDEMGSGVVFHALEGTDLRVGNRVTYGPGAIVHGGGRPALDVTTGLAAPTTVGNDVRLGAGAVVFRSLLRNDSRVGSRSVVVGSELALRQRIPARTVYANDKVFGPVEW